MRLKKIGVGVTALVFSGLVCVPIAHAGIAVQDAQQNALGVAEKLGVLINGLQMFNTGITTMAQYTSQGDFRQLAGKGVSAYTKDLSWFNDSKMNDAFGTVADKKLPSGGSSDEKGEGSGSGVTKPKETGDVSTIMAQADKAYLLPADEQAQKEMTDDQVKAVKQAQREAHRETTLKSYSTAVAMQAELAKFPEENAPALQSVVDSAETETEIGKGTATSIQFLATQMNLNNAIQAAGLELQAMSAMKMVDG